MGPARLTAPLKPRTRCTGRPVALTAQRQPVGGQVAQTAPLRQPDRGHQTTARHEIRIIETVRNVVRDSHLPDALLVR